MKTDRFTDIIRRKLESIRPEFTDKDWARIQATLKDANLSQPNLSTPNQPFSGGVWSSGKSWLLAAASVSTVVLIAFSMWQQREINHLRQAISQPHKHSANQSAPALSNPEAAQQTQPNVAQTDAIPPDKQSRETTALPNRNEGQAVRPDTVYITRYVAVPSRIKPDVHTEDPLTQRLETPANQRSKIDNSEFPSVTTRQPNTLNKKQQTESYDVFSTPPIAPNTFNEPGIKNKLMNPSAGEKGLITQSKEERNTKRSDTSPSNLVNNQSSGAVNNGGVTNNGVAQAEPSVAASAPNETSVNYELAASLPLSIESKNWSAELAQRAKRMRSARTIVVAAEPEQTPTSQPIQQLAARFRLGVSGEVTSHLWSAGAFTEVLLGHHWTVGVGINQATYVNRFITEDDFNNRTHRDFRKDFARPGDLWRDILNIDTRQVRLQVPVSLGYRIPLNQSLSLVPSISTYLNLTNSENITYYCRDYQHPPMKPPYQSRYDETNIRKAQPVDLLSNIVLGTGIEWQRSHWVAQASPVLTIPMQNSQLEKKNDLNWQKNATAGLRIRLLYQF